MKRDSGNSKPENGEYRKRKTWRLAKRHLKRTHRGFLNLIEKRVEELKPSENDRNRFLSLCGRLPIGGAIRASDLVARFRYARFIAQEVRDLARASDDLDFYFLTLLADEGIMSDRTPRYLRRTLGRKADKAMRKVDLDGLFVVEVQAVTSWPRGGKGRTLLAHVHILGWKQKASPNNSAEYIKRELGWEKKRRNIPWTSRLGADPIHVRHLTEQLGCPSYWAAYLLKAPHDAKNLVPPKEDELGKFPAPKARMMSTTKGYRPELAMRIFELMAQIPLSSVVSGTGSGATMLGRCRTLLALWDKERMARWAEDGKEWVGPFDERAFWKRTHRRRRAKYRRFFIDGPTIKARDSSRRV